MRSPREERGQRERERARVLLVTRLLAQLLATRGRTQHGDAVRKRSVVAQ